MDIKEKIIKEYFTMWTNKNFDNLDTLFDAKIYYSECYGPEYQGIREIKQWIHELSQKQTVLEWNIKQFIHQDNIVVVEWYFKDYIKQKASDFNGVSIIEFTEDNKIISIKEFESKAQHTTPFKNVRE